MITLPVTMLRNRGHVANGMPVTISPESRSPWTGIRNPSRIITANCHILAVRDVFPASPGHTLVIARRHIVSLFEAIREERGGLQAGLPQLEFSEMIGFRREEYFAAVRAGLDRNYLPMKNLLRDVIERSVCLWDEQ